MAKGRNLCFGMPLRFKQDGGGYRAYVTKPSEMDPAFEEEVLLGYVETYRCGGGRSIRWRCFRPDGRLVATGKTMRRAAVDELYAARFGNPLIKRK
jgi:hypothetical protein